MKICIVLLLSLFISQKSISAQQKLLGRDIVISIDSLFEVVGFEDSTEQYRNDLSKKYTNAFAGMMARLQEECIFDFAENYRIAETRQSDIILRGKLIRGRANVMKYSEPDYQDPSNPMKENLDAIFIDFFDARADTLINYIRQSTQKDNFFEATEQQLIEDYYEHLLTMRILHVFIPSSEVLGPRHNASKHSKTYNIVIDDFFSADSKGLEKVAEEITHLANNMFVQEQYPKSEFAYHNFNYYPLYRDIKLKKIISKKTIFVRGKLSVEGDRLLLELDFKGEDLTLDFYGQDDPIKQRITCDLERIKNGDYLELMPILSESLGCLLIFNLR